MPEPRSIGACAVMLALAGCPDEGPSPADGSSDGTGGTAGASSSTADDTAGTADETSGEEGPPPPTDCELLPAFTDPLVAVGGDEPGIDGLVSLAATATHAYGCTHDAGMVVWTLADPSPSVLGTGYDATGGMPPRCDAVTLSPDGTQLVTARRAVDGEGAVTVWDLGDPDAPAALATWTTALPVEAAVMGNARVFVAAGPEGLRSLAFDGSALVEQGSFVDGDSDARDLVWADDLLVVAESREGLRTYDTSGADPVLQGAAGLGARAVDVELAGDRAYVATLDAAAIVDLSDPAAPALVSQAPTAGAATDVVVAGELLLVADWDEVRGLSLADPSTPQHVFGQLAPGADGRGRARALTMAGERVAVSSWGGLYLFDLEAQPLAPELELESLRVDFREVPAGESDDFVLVLRNTGNAPLSLCGFESTLEGLEIDVPAMEIDAESTLVLELTYTSPDGSAQQGALTIYGNDPDEPTRVVPLSANTPRNDVGDPMLYFHHLDSDGRALSSDALEGQVVLLSYFASW